jgi:hypothetical protein
VGEFSELNSRIHENIKLWCLGTSIGVDLRHLRHLESDPNSRTLGFDIDARPQMATSQAEHAASLEIDEWEVKQSFPDTRKVGERFEIARRENDSFLLEYRSYSPSAPVSVELDGRTRDLVDRLANLLHQPKEIGFRTPSCVGWFRGRKDNKVAYVFNIPVGFDPSPISLLDVLESGDLAAPSLSERFKLALRLSRCISQLQLVKWVSTCFIDWPCLAQTQDMKDYKGHSHCFPAGP